MRTDPRAACANKTERFGWAFVHDLFAHPLMALTRWSRWALRFHDWTSNRAWPRDLPPPNVIHFHDTSRHGRLAIRHYGDGDFAVTHGFVNHTFVSKADSVEEACANGLAWFNQFEWMMGPCRHYNVASIARDEQDNLFQCTDCGMRRGADPASWREDREDYP